MNTQNDVIELPTLISDGMVLQRNTKVRLWGKANPGESLTITFLEKSYRTEADNDGAWEIILDELSAGGPYDMIVESENERKLVKNVLVGDVWVLGGQSNMQITIARTLDLFENEVNNAECAFIRQFVVPERYDFHGPREELSGGSWFSVTPETIYKFSAIGYFYAKKLYEKYNVPIGLILAAIGGTPAEAWMSEKSLMRFGRFQEILSLCKEDSYVNGTRQREEMRSNRWYHEIYETDEGIQTDKPWYSESYDASGWDSFELPASFHGTELEYVKGSIWFRKEIDVPERMLKGKAKLILGTLIDGDDTYLNGIQIGNTGYLYPPRRYPIPEGLLKKGKNVLAVRLIVNQNIGAFVTDMPYFIKSNNELLPISGTWKYRIGSSIRALPPATFFQYKPTGVYNGMIYPLRKFNIRGALWYHGESNTEYPYDYKELFEAVIKDWRATWNCGDFPFFYVQLANYCPWRLEPDISGLARLREEQRKAMDIKNTGMAVTYDVGEYNDLHPQNKKAVGERLSLWAQNVVFGEAVVCSGPIYDHKEIIGSRVRLYFNHIGKGLTAKNGDLKTFTICSKNGQYVPAKAVIENDTVVVYSEAVTEPVNVRYAWSDNPEDANLYNIDGLPASPFTTEI